MCVYMYVYVHMCVCVYVRVRVCFCRCLFVLSACVQVPEDARDEIKQDGETDGCAGGNKRDRQMLREATRETDGCAGGNKRDR